MLLRVGRRSGDPQSQRVERSLRQMRRRRPYLRLDIFIIAGTATPTAPSEVRGGPEHALRYLSHYTHGVAISNHRLVFLVDDQIPFRRRDSADNNQPEVMTLSLDEFLRRFRLHLAAQRLRPHSPLRLPG